MTPTNVPLLYTDAILYRCCMFRDDSHPLYETDYTSYRDKIG